MPLVLNMCMDIAAGLSYIHARDIIHGKHACQVMTALGPLHNFGYQS
jgi:hypothetical protein